MFILKKIIALFLMPMSLCLGLLGVGISILLLRRFMGTAKIVLTLGFLVLTALSFTVVADQVIKPLELWYPPLLETSELKDVKWVVVLGGGHISNAERPPNAQVFNSSLSRIIEGIRIHRALPESKLILSGGAVFDPVPEAVTMSAVASMLGVSPKDMILESPALLVPGNDSSISNFNDFIFQSTGAPATYKVIVQTNLFFGEIWQKNITTSSIYDTIRVQVPSGVFNYNTIYYWRVASFTNSELPNSFSELNKFTIKPF